MGRLQAAAPPQVRRVVWTDEAVRNLDNIAAYLNELNPWAAQRLATSLLDAADSLVEHPDRGRSVGEGRRELTVINPYIIRYRVETSTVYILRIRHGAQRPTS